MADIAAWVDDLGGMAQKRQLVRRGARDHDLTVAVRDGSVTRVRNGWYSTLDEEDPRLRAVRVGGRLTGLTMIAALGGWVRSVPPLHVSLAQNAARMRTQRNRRRRLDVRSSRGVTLHWEPDEVSKRGTATSVGLADALFRVIVDESLEDAVAALDWALHSGHIDRSDLEQLMMRVPRYLQWIADWVDEACESLPESLARTRLRLAGYAVRSQVPLGKVERIDLVVADIVSMEVDGFRFHLDRFEQDRAKDLRMTIARFHPIRPSARSVFYDWPSVLLAVEVALAVRGVPPATAQTLRTLRSQRQRNLPTRAARSSRGPRRSRTTTAARTQSCDAVSVSAGGSSLRLHPPASAG